MHDPLLAGIQPDDDVALIAADNLREGSGRAGELPAARVARTTYHGAYEGLHAAWVEFGKRLLIGDCRQVAAIPAFPQRPQPRIGENLEGQRDIGIEHYAQCSTHSVAFSTPVALIGLAQYIVRPPSNMTPRFPARGAGPNGYGENDARTL